MKVYRYLSEDELNRFMTGDISDLGGFYNDSDYDIINTHRYKKGTRYLHFYLKRKDIKYVQHLHNQDAEKDYYCCTFNIPVFTLLKYKGKGKYDSLKRGYGRDLDQVVEFAIPTSEILPSYLREYALDEVYHRCMLAHKKEMEDLRKLARGFRFYSNDFVD